MAVGLTLEDGKEGLEGERVETKSLLEVANCVLLGGLLH
jgi:hypothetical protein